VKRTAKGRAAVDAVLVLCNTLGRGACNVRWEKEKQNYQETVLVDSV